MQLSKEGYARNSSIMVVRCEFKILSLGITVRHLSANLVILNSYARDGIYNLHLTTIKDSFSFLQVQATVPRGFCVTLAAFNQQVQVRKMK